MALEGVLQDMSLVDLARIFHMGQKTGLLLLVNTHERGVVYVVAGRLVDAIVARSSDRQVIAIGEGAVLHMLQWNDASFTFQQNSSPLRHPVRITRDSTSLMLEGLRRREQPLAASYHQRITLDTPLELAPLPANADSRMGLSIEQWRLLNLIAVSQNVRTLCNRTGMSIDSAMRMTSELIAVGLIDIVAHETASAPHQNNATHDDRRATSMAVQSRTLPIERSLFHAVLRRVRAL